MESSCLVITNPAYGVPTLPEKTDAGTSATRRAATEEARNVHMIENNAYASLEYACVTSTSNGGAGTRTVTNTYEEVRIGRANSRTTSATESFSLRKNVHAKHAPQQLRSVLFELHSTNGLYSTLFEQNGARGKRRKRRDLACDVAIAFAALASMMLSGAVIASCAAYESHNVTLLKNSSHVGNNTTYTQPDDQCNCTLQGELSGTMCACCYVYLSSTLHAYM